MRLHRSPGVGRTRPDFEIAVGWQLHGGGPALPVILVLRLFKCGALPSGAEIGRDIHLPAVSRRPEAPRSFIFLGPAANFSPFAGLVIMERTGSDSDRKFPDQLAPGTIGLIAVR